MAKSLRVGLWAIGLISAIILPLITALGFRAAFESHVYKSTASELEADLRFMTRGLKLENGLITLVPKTLPDPRFEEPLSGLYWQIVDDKSKTTVRSGSLVTFTIALPQDDLPLNIVHRHIVLGPDGTELMVLERRIPEGVKGKQSWRFAVAIERDLLERQVHAIMSDTMPVFILLGLGLLVLTFIQGQILLGPLNQASRALSLVHAGLQERLTSTVPSELDDFARDFDALLDASERQAREARERAADLAHSLRTPLAVLMARADEIEIAGLSAAAASIRDIVGGLEHRATRDLARAHIHGPILGRLVELPLAPIINQIANALARSSATENLTWDVQVDADHKVKLDQSDLTELIGSLLDNARKWAKSRIKIATICDPSRLRIIIDDDGPGIEPHLRRMAISRGQKFDAHLSGTGLGLSIAQEIIQAYGGSLELSDGVLGGLRVTLNLPHASIGLHGARST
ncbi:virulence sensor histidine kinase PhoQ [Candidatus Phycosocius bacilliformis]|uniref:histidine kinase n=1 Tax=Candidatus Phycosocius bacilliformis TaxID=1445552 RepID=A0A2P2ED25_9PROT|nr:HAMP domain-containing sensor histidine kinase [Candidatus Phycosocius bacilliformis]GBF58954.1 virulence sensor histidine kinase PhoQ [Candidatus Phycosocius bacilliformis]